MRTVAGLILAAGSSSRLGRAKQLIRYEGETLVARAVRIARVAGCAPVAVVLGSSAGEIAHGLRDVSALIVQNEHWERGLGTSIRAGLLALLETEPNLDAVVLLVCDQLRVTALTIGALRDEQERSGKPIVASSYADTLGIPALFARPVFAQLLALPEASGAKGLIEKHPAHVAQIAFDDGTIDLDTPADLARFCHDD